MSGRSGHSPLSLMHSSGGRAGHLKIDVTALTGGQCLHQVPPRVTHVVTCQAAQAAPRWPSFTACPSHQGESNYFNTICLGLGCVTTHWHQQEHKATLKCGYVRHSYVGTIFSHDKLLAQQHPPSRMEINSPKMACGCPYGTVNKKIKSGDTPSPLSLTLWNASYVNVQVYVYRVAPVFSLGLLQPHFNIKPRALLHIFMCLYDLWHSWQSPQSSGAVWKLRWPSLVPVPNKPMVSVDVQEHFWQSLNQCT